MQKIIYIIAESIARLASFWVLYIIVRSFPISEFGYFSLLMTLGAIFGCFTDLGINQILYVRLGEEGADTHSILRWALRTRVILALSAFLVSMIFVPLLVPRGLSLGSSIFLFGLVSGGAFIGLGNSIWIYFGRLNLLSFYKIISNGILVLSVGWVIYNGKSLETIMVIWGVVWTLTGSLQLVYIYSYISKTVWELSLSWDLLRYSAVGLVTVLFGQLGILIVGKFGTLEDVGLFSIIQKIAFSASFLLLALASMLSPPLYRSVKSNRVLEVFREYLGLCVGTAYVLGSILIMAMPIVLRILLKGKNVPFQWYHGIYIVVLLFEAASYPLGDLLSARGEPQFRVISFIIAIGLSLASALVLRKIHIGSLLVIMLSAYMACNLLLWHFCQKSKESLPKNLLFGIYIAAVLLVIQLTVSQIGPWYRIFSFAIGQCVFLAYWFIFYRGNKIISKSKISTVRLS